MQINLNNTPLNTYLDLKTLTTSSIDKDVEQLELSYTGARSVNWNNHFG